MVFRGFLITFAAMTSNAPDSCTAPSFWRRVWLLYADGFRSMTIGKKLWAIIIIKLVIIFLVLKLFFFPNFLASKSDTPEGKAQVVRECLTHP